MDIVGTHCAALETRITGASVSAKVRRPSYITGSGSTAFTSLAARLEKDYLNACAELEKQIALFDLIKNGFDPQVRAKFENDSLFRGGEQYRPTVHEGTSPAVTADNRILLTYVGSLKSHLALRS